MRAEASPLFALEVPFRSRRKLRSRRGIQIVMKAIEEPLRQIVFNSGGEPSVVVNKVIDLKGNDGFNAATDEYGDLVSMGVVDPTK